MLIILQRHTSSASNVPADQLKWAVNVAHVSAVQPAGYADNEQTQPLSFVRVVGDASSTCVVGSFEEIVAQLNY